MIVEKNNGDKKWHTIEPRENLKLNIFKERNHTKDEWIFSNIFNIK